MNRIELTGIDGTNPLGFLAAVGAAATLHQAGEHDVKLAWTRRHTWIPVLDGCCSQNDVCKKLESALKGKVIAREADERREKAQKAFDAAKKRSADMENEIRRRKLKGDDQKRALRSAKRHLRLSKKRAAWLKTLKKTVPSPELALGKRPDCTSEEFRYHAKAMLQTASSSKRMAVDMLAAFGSDICLDGNSNIIEPTPFCFIRGSGNQWFLDTARQLMSKVTDEALRRTLFEPWTYRHEKLSMRWDPVEDKQYALTDIKPADQGARTEWMANLLAYRALALFPSAPTRRGLGTTGWRSTQEGDLEFTWPIWDCPVSVEMIQSCIALTSATELSALRARGIVAIYRARRIKVGSGANFKLNFSPARAT